MSGTGAMRRMADVSDAGSLSNRFRERRFAYFNALVEGLGRPLHLVDVGGTTTFWERRGWAGRDDVHVTVVNLEADRSPHGNLTCLGGGYERLREFGDRSFDVAFSNSVIEHLFTRENQAAMAGEVRRVAKAYWVQTPNYWFPMEPHFHVPGWQWMPRSARVALLRRRRCGWRGPCPDPVEAGRLVDEVQLLTGRELRSLFPGGTLWAERFLGLVKSWVVHDGFDAGRPRG